MAKSIEGLKNIVKELKLAWLEEEIDAIISEGKLTSNPNDKKGGFNQKNYIEEEQIKIIKEILLHYFVGLPEIHDKTLTQFCENSNIETFLIDSENEKLKIPTSEEVTKIKELLNSI